MSDDAHPPEKKVFLGFGGRLEHGVPWWVRGDAIFHIRVRCAPGCKALTEPETARALLDSAGFYHERRRWCAHLFLLMPDHWHALLSFPADAAMSRVIGDWKKFHTRHTGIEWQEGYFDHRLRDHLDQLNAKFSYIRRNPVVKGLCVAEDDWPWQWRGENIGTDTRPETGAR